MVVIGHNASDVNFIYDLQDFVEFLEQHDISKEDLVGFIVEGLNKEVPWLADGIFGHDGFCVRGRADGIWGDDWYEYLREVRELADEVDVEVKNLHSNSRKNNTKADIARRLSNVVANLRNLT